MIQRNYQLGAYPLISVFHSSSLGHYWQLKFGLGQLKQKWLPHLLLRQLQKPHLLLRCCRTLKMKWRQSPRPGLCKWWSRDDYDWSWEAQVVVNSRNFWRELQNWELEQLMTWSLLRSSNYWRWQPQVLYTLEDLDGICYTFLLGVHYSGFFKNNFVQKCIQSTFTDVPNKLKINIYIIPYLYFLYPIYSQLKDSQNSWFFLFSYTLTMKHWYKNNSKASNSVQFCIDLT